MKFKNQEKNDGSVFISNKIIIFKISENNEKWKIQQTTPLECGFYKVKKGDEKM